MMGNWTIEFNNWFYAKCEDGTRMWSFNTPGFGIVKSKGYFLFYIDFLFWGFAIEYKNESNSNG